MTQSNQRQIPKSLIALVALGLSPATLAEATAAPAAVEQALALEEEEVEGTIESYDADANTFVLKVGDEEVTVTVNDRTTYEKEGEEITRDKALRVGATVTVTHEGRVASKVDVKPRG